MNKPYKKILLSLAGTVLLIVFVFICWLLWKSNESGFAKEFNDIDLYIQSGFYSQAAEALDSTYTEIKNSSDSLKFLKRCFILSQKTLDYSLLKEYSFKLHSRFSRNVEIAAVYSYSLIKTQNYNKSLEVSGKFLKKSDYDYLYFYNVLKTGISPDEKKIMTHLQTDYGYKQEIDSYNKEKLLYLKDLDYDERYFVDLALLSASEGNFSEAHQYLLNTDARKFNKLKMTIAYDSQDYDAAVKYYHTYLLNTNEADNLYRLLGCDSLIKNGYFKEAEVEYNFIVETAPKFSSIPYRNLYSLNKNDPHKADLFLKEGLKIFPDSSILSEAHAFELYMNNDFQKLENSLEFEEENPPDTPLFDLLRLNSITAYRNPEHIIGELWVLFNKYPDSEEVCKYFANYLLRNSNLDTASVLIEKYSHLNKTEDWILTYKAVISALEGKLTDAAEIISRAVELNSNYLNRYNQAYILALTGRDRDAADVFLSVADDVEKNHENNAFLSKVYLKLSESYYNIKDYESANYYIILALDIDAYSFTGRILLNKIQEELYD